MQSRFLNPVYPIELLRSFGLNPAEISLTPITSRTAEPRVASAAKPQISLNPVIQGSRRSSTLRALTAQESWREFGMLVEVESENCPKRRKICRVSLRTQERVA